MDKWGQRPILSGEPDWPERLPGAGSCSTFILRQLGDNKKSPVGDWEFRFGPQNLDGPTAEGRPARFLATLKTKGQVSYKAAVLLDGGACQ